MNQRQNYLKAVSTCFFLICAQMLPTLASAGNPLIDDKKLSDINPQDVIHWQPINAKYSEDGTLVEVDLQLQTDNEFTIYVENLEFKGSSGFILRNYNGPAKTVITDPHTDKKVEVYAEGNFQVYFQGLEPFKGELFNFSIKYLGCAAQICLFPYTQNMSVPAYLSRTKIDPDAKKPDVNKQTTELTVSKNDAQDQEDLQVVLADKLRHGDFSVGMLFIIVFLGGLLTNLTPCVYPMIPITIRVLANQKFHPLIGSSLYAIGIVVTYTSLGVVASLSGNMFGSLMTSVTFNVVFAVIMALLGLTMLGFGNFSWLQNLGNKFGSGKPSIINTFLMGVGAGFVASPCTGPILAALLAYTAKSQNVMLGTELLFVYSLGFALPYVFLGGAASKISKMKVSHHVQLATKLVFASVMFALALYYLRVPAYGVFVALTPVWPVATCLGLVVGISLIVVWLLKPVLHSSKYLLIIPAAVFGIGVFAGSQWITGHGSKEEATGPHWMHSVEAGMKAQRAGIYMIVDNWAEWCEACKKLDVTTFIEPSVVSELKEHWIAVKMDLTKGTDADDAHQAKFGIQGLPTIILLPPDGDLNKKELITGYVSASTLLKKLKEFRGE